jgi:hypothetical protein
MRKTNRSSKLGLPYRIPVLTDGDFFLFFFNFGNNSKIVSSQIKLLTEASLEAGELAQLPSSRQTFNGVSPNVPEGQAASSNFERRLGLKMRPAFDPDTRQTLNGGLV